ncbi:DUF7507 domain-containing protein [Caulobacter sp. KR2-114]|uniref:DUF7507 domain-containing protein n=1 Tax=Caulobacter sp. KR2-114 TaxID=3400912 RepID=UPI003C10567F
MSTTDLNDGAFYDSTSVNSGTGNYDSFLRIQASPTEDGYNTSAGVPLDDKGGVWTHSILLSALQVVSYNGVDCYEIRIDLNETNSKGGPAIDLSQFDLYVGAAATANDFTAAGVTSDPNLAKVYSLTPGLGLTDISNGSGTDDGAIYVPVSLFANAPTGAYLTLFAAFTGSDGGFEEFRALTNPGVPVNGQGDIVMAKIPDVTQVDQAGQVIHYTIDVNNDGTGALHNLVVTDPLASDIAPTLNGSGFNVGDTNSNNALDPGETWVYTASHTVTQGEIDLNGNPDANSGFIFNEALATDTEGVNAFADSTVDIVRNPALSLVKSFTTAPSDPADLDGAGNGEVDTAGQLINYTIHVTNSGNVTLTNVTVTDPLDPTLGNVVGTIASLAPGQSQDLTFSIAATQDQIDNGAPINNTAHGTDDQNAATDSNQVTTLIDQDPALKVVKLASVKDGTADHAGDEIDYTVTVQNTGNVTLTGLNLTDSVPDVTLTYQSGDTDGNGKLSVGETWTFTGAHIVTQADLDGKGNATPLPDGAFHNTASATTDQGATDQSSASTPLVYNPAISATKVVDHISNGTPSAHWAGDIVFYDFTVSNTGNITLNAPTLSDPLVSNVTPILASGFNAGDINQNGLLDVGETWQYMGSHTVTQAELDAKGNALPADGLLHNTVTVSDHATVLGDAVQTTASATAPLDYDPHIKLQKTVADVLNADHSLDSDGKIDTAGDIVDYNFAVTNTGNVSLLGTTPTDPLISNIAGKMSGAYNVGDTNHDGLINPGETWLFTGSMGVTQAQINAAGNGGFIVNTATVNDTGVSGGTVTDTSSANVQVALAGPGVRTPGFWMNNGSALWDGNGATMSNGGTLNIVKAGGDLLRGYNVDINGDHLLTGAETSNAGQYLLIGDWNRDGITDNGEHTILISRTDALALLNASQKQQGDGRWLLGRDLVASWLDYLAGNGVGPVDSHGVPLTSAAPGYDANSPGHYMDDAIQWLTKETTLGTGGLLSLGSGHNTMPGPAAIATSSSAWNSVVNPLDKTAADMHASLDGYNNTGTIHGSLYAPLPSV